MKRQQRKARSPLTIAYKKARAKKRKAKLKAQVGERTKYLRQTLVVTKAALKMAAMEIAGLRKMVAAGGSAAQAEAPANGV